MPVAACVMRHRLLDHHRRRRLRHIDRHRGRWRDQDDVGVDRERPLRHHLMALGRKKPRRIVTNRNLPAAVDGHIEPTVVAAHRRAVFGVTENGDLRSPERLLRRVEHPTAHDGGPHPVDGSRRDSLLRRIGPLEKTTRSIVKESGRRSIERRSARWERRRRTAFTVWLRPASASFIPGMPESPEGPPSVASSEGDPPELLQRAELRTNTSRTRSRAIKRSARARRSARCDVIGPSRHFIRMCT